MTKSLDKWKTSFSDTVNISRAGTDAQRMWLVDRDTSGEGPNRIPLPGPLRAALVRWYVGEGDHGDEQAGIRLVQNARIGHKWLACDCLGRQLAPRS